MKKADIVVGGTYVVRVSGHLVPVRLEAESVYGGWVGRNMRTGREIRIRTAGKLRRPYTEPSVRQPSTVHAIIAWSGNPADETPRCGADKNDPHVVMSRTVYADHVTCMACREVLGTL